MRTIGLIGGMSWESTELYYRWINEATRRRRGGLHSAPIVLYSVDFEPIERLQHQGDWVGAGEILAQAACALEKAGADCVLICTNTMHKVAPAVAAAVNIPLLHLADATATKVVERQISTVGLLGTRFTMQEDFYRARLEQCGLKVQVPTSEEQEVVHRIIYDELCVGVVKPESRQIFVEIVESLRARGVEAVIEGCTEIVMLLQQQHTDMPLFDTTAIHADAAVEWALQTG